MSDKAYENALSRRPHVQAEIADLEKRLSGLRGELLDIDNFLDLWRRFAGEVVAERLPVSEPPRKRNSKKEEVAAAARRIIEAEGRPLSRTELYERLVGAGLTINGSDPEMVLSTMLWRMQDQIVRLAKGGYWLAGTPYKEEFYSADPQRDDLLDSVDDTPPASGITADDD